MGFTKDQTTAFLFGLGASISVRIIGIVAFSDIIALLSLPYILIQKNNFTDKKFRTLIILLLLWMMSTIISDFYNNTSFLDSVKGFFSLVPFLACLIFANWLLKKNHKLIIPFLWGYAVSILFGAGFGVDQFFNEAISQASLGGVAEYEQYKLKIGSWILNAFIAGAFTITYYKRFPIFTVIVIIISSFVYLLIGSRSIFLINFLTAVLLIYFNIKYKNFDENSLLEKEKRRKLLVQLGAIILISLPVTMIIYEVSAAQGLLGEQEFRKFEYQENTGIGILSGRYEIVSAFLAIYDSPIFGHGSYARDFNNYGLSAALITGLPFESLMELRDASFNYIPTHSHLWQAWVNNGFLGGLFWFYVLFGILFSFISKHLFTYPDYFAYLILSTLLTFWNILFSPFSQKPFLSMSIVFLIVLMRRSDELGNSRG